MSKHLSPLRYPGGKAKFTDYLYEIIRENRPIDTYVEPYAGGAGAALNILNNNYVNNIVINDIDYFVYCFWKSIIEKPKTFIKKIKQTDVTLDNFYLFKEIYKKREIKKYSTLDLGFTAFYLNRCSRSGILTAGPIGGLEQKSKWKINCRFNKENLIERIQVIARLRERISIYNLDAINLIEYLINNDIVKKERSLIYLDPPYVEKGGMLYRRNYEVYDHKRLNTYLKKQYDLKWVLSYDDDPLIHDLYKGIKKNGLKVNHFASKAKIGKELLILSDKCKSPSLYTTNEN